MDHWEAPLITMTLQNTGISIAASNTLKELIG